MFILVVEGEQAVQERGGSDVVADDGTHSRDDLFEVMMTLPLM